jgi:hypothetical protein
LNTTLIEKPDISSDIDETPLFFDHDQFPENVFVIEIPSTKQFVCWHFQEINGLVVFSDKANAIAFANDSKLKKTKVYQVTFDEARDIAITRPPAIIAVMLCDDPCNPQIHYIR